MIDLVLRFIAEETNAFLLRRNGSDFGSAFIGPIVNAAGALQHAQDSMRITLLQVEEERTLREQLPQRSIVSGREVLLPPPLRLNLTLIYSAHFQQYDQALRQLSLVLKFFAARPLFAIADYPGLPQGLERVAVDLISHSPEQLNQIWACLGAKHMPHLIYRVRVLPLQDTEPTGSGAPIVEIHHDLHGMPPSAVAP